MITKLFDIWQNLPIAKKATIAVALIGVLGMSVLILNWTGGSTNMRPLVSGADAADLSEVVDILNSNQVPFEYNEAGDTILVPEDKRAAMRMELAMKGLPKTGDVGF